MSGAPGSIAGSRSQTGHLPVGEERQMVRADGRKKWLISGVLKSGTKYDGWQKPAGTNDSYTL